jgi:hypothetical protein
MYAECNPSSSHWSYPSNYPWNVHKWDIFSLLHEMIVFICIVDPRELAATKVKNSEHLSIGAIIGITVAALVLIATIILVYCGYGICEYLILWSLCIKYVRYYKTTQTYRFKNLGFNFLWHFFIVIDIYRFFLIIQQNCFIEIE